MRTDDRFVSTTPKDGAKRADRRQIGARRGDMTDEEGAGEEDSNRTAGRLWPFGKAKLGAQEIGAQRGSIVNGGAAGEGEERKSRADFSCLYEEADAVGAERRTSEPDVVVQDEIGCRMTSVVTKRRVHRGAMSIITTQRMIPTRRIMLRTKQISK